MPLLNDIWYLVVFTTIGWTLWQLIKLSREGDN